MAATKEQGYFKVVDGISDGKLSKFQRRITMAVKHLYSIAGNSQFVLPFCFLINLPLFIIKHSKLALSVVSKMLPGGSYYAVTSWRRSLALVPQPFPTGDCITAFYNDKIVQRKWKVEVVSKQL